jgi:acyl carrier protein
VQGEPEGDSTKRKVEEGGMTRAEIESEVIEIICDHIGFVEQEVSLDTKLFDDLELDLMDTNEIIKSLEYEFDITLGRQSGMETVRDIVDMVERAI